jgi:hypothetical protein
VGSRLKKVADPTWAGDDDHPAEFTRIWMMVKKLVAVTGVEPVT